MSSGMMVSTTIGTLKCLIVPVVGNNYREETDPPRCYCVIYYLLVAGLEGAKAALKEAVILPTKFPQVEYFSQRIG